MIKMAEVAENTMLAVRSKICSGCKRVLALDAFQRNKCAKDGHQGYCKQCAKEYQKAYIYERHGRIQGERKKYRGEDMKRCPGCERILEKTHFTKCVTAEYGIDTYCKRCHNMKQRRYHSAHRDIVNKKERARARERYLANPDSMRVKQAEYRKQFKSMHGISINQRKMQLQPEKVRARRNLRKAVERGRIAKPAFCQICLTACNPHGHHDDYSAPLAVRWVCQACHSVIHGRSPYQKGGV
jgi:hypothetical protein